MRNQWLFIINVEDLLKLIRQINLNLIKIGMILTF